MVKALERAIEEHPTTGASWNPPETASGRGLRPVDWFDNPAPFR
jgi:hypothetical protein